MAVLVKAGYTEDQAKAVFSGVVSSTLDGAASQISAEAVTNSVSGGVESTVQQVAGAAAVSGAQGVVTDYSGKLSSLKSATSELEKGTSEVNTGLAGADGKAKGSKNLIGGAKLLSGGTTALYNGTVTFSSKEAELASGAATLAKGAKTLDKSVDSAVDKVKSEVDKLSASNLLDVVDNAKAIQKAAQDYNSFGSSKTYKSVTFIYKMDEVSPK